MDVKLRKAVRSSSHYAFHGPGSFRVDGRPALRLIVLKFQSPSAHPPLLFVLKGCEMTKARLLSVSMFLALAVVLTSGASAQQPAAHVLPKVAKVTVNDPVTLTDNGDSWTLDNGIVKMTILKRNGNISSLIYHGIETQTHGEYWEQTPSGTDHRKGDHRPGNQRRRTRRGLRAGRQPRRPQQPQPHGRPSRRRRARGAGTARSWSARRNSRRRRRAQWTPRIRRRASRRPAARRPARRRHGHRDALHHGARRQRLLHLRRVHPQGLVSAGGRGREPLHPGVDEPNLQLALRRPGPQPADDLRCGPAQGRRHPRQGAAHPAQRRLCQLRRTQVQLQRRDVPAASLGMVQHNGPHRRLLHQPVE